MNQEYDIIETDRNLRKNIGCFPQDNQTCNFLLEMAYSLNKVEVDDTDESSMNVLYHLMPIQFTNSKVVGSIIFEGHTDQLAGSQHVQLRDRL